MLTGLLIEIFLLVARAAPLGHPKMPIERFKITLKKEQISKGDPDDIKLVRSIPKITQQPMHQLLVFFPNNIRNAITQNYEFHIFYGSSLP